MENAATRMVRGQDPIRYHVRRQVRQSVMASPAPHTRFLTVPAHYFHTAETGGKIDRSRPTQVGRALEQLGVEHIGAYSPQARGRSERAFQTLQDRPRA